MCIPSLSEYWQVIEPSESNALCPIAICFTYISYPTQSEVGVVICFCTDAEIPSQIFYKVALILFLMSIYDGACNIFNIPSYIPNMMAALGTVLNR